MIGRPASGLSTLPTGRRQVERAGWLVGWLVGWLNDPAFAGPPDHSSRAGRQAGRLPSSEGSCQGQASLPEADKLAASMIE